MDLALAQHIVKGTNNQNGLGYLEWYGSHRVYHPGEDLNKGSGNHDLGLPITTVADGDVVWTGYHRGFGNHMVMSHPQLNRWTHYVHLQKHILKVGDKMKAGEVVSYVGNTGTKWAHLHFEVWRPHLFELQKNYRNRVGYKVPFAMYPTNWPKWKVAQHYEDPAVFVRNALKLKDKLIAPVPNKVELLLYRDKFNGKIYLVHEEKFYHITDEKTFDILFGGFANAKWANGSAPDKNVIGGKLKLTK